MCSKLLAMKPCKAMLARNLATAFIFLCGADTAEGGSVHLPQSNALRCCPDYLLKLPEGRAFAITLEKHQAEP